MVEVLVRDISRGEERRSVPLIARDGWPMPPAAALADIAAFQVGVCPNRRVGKNVLFTIEETSFRCYSDITV